ncbi:sigma-70 family RNA polymerase sigma factor [Trinickia sp. Y13]|uniref:RNA polymerase sigma factor n=1 Tax=Trinickia sp. Y13 TaxID=2917807 RepID=UPI002404E746|nr:sigma-70 family RNA polymerase sigma factor [Trinickia sp. Y13]MDG0025904.1 sigma-70 family RNA polymerase sigma factor [Trinickia sp. Y13]
MTTMPNEPTPPVLAALLARVAAEDAAALRTIYEMTSAKLFGVALRILVRREWAEDVLQESFVNIWRYAGDYREPLSAPLTWMAAIVRNRALDYLRRHKAATADGTGLTTEWSEALDEMIPGDERDPADSAMMSEQARQLSVCMGRLESGQRQAVALAYLRDKSHSEIAQELSVPLGTVKSWVRRGLEKLKICMGHR